MGIKEPGKILRGHEPSTSFDVNSPYYRSEVKEDEPLSFRPSYFNETRNANLEYKQGSYNIERKSYNRDSYSQFQSKSAHNIVRTVPTPLNDTLNERISVENMDQPVTKRLSMDLKSFDKKPPVLSVDMTQEYGGNSSTWFT